MSSAVASEMAAPGEQTATPGPSASPDLAPQVSSSPKTYDANMLAARKYPSPETKDVPEKPTEKTALEKVPAKKAKLVLKNKNQKDFSCDQAAEVPNAKSTKPSKKRKAESQIITKSELKSNQVSDSDLPPKKKAKRASPGTKKVAPKATGKEEAQDRGTKNHEIKEKAPPSRAPTVLTQAVANKVQQVIRFAEVPRNSKLDRDLKNKDLISVPESLLLSAVIRMRLHYQLGDHLRASISDVEEAIVERFKRSIGSEPDLDWVTIDASRTTNFESQVQEEIACYILSEVSLLETELEMCKRDLLKQFGQADHAEDLYDGDRSSRTFQDMWERVVAKEAKTSVENAPPASGGAKAVTEDDKAVSVEDSLAAGFGLKESMNKAAESATRPLDSAKCDEAHCEAAGGWADDKSTQVV